MNTRGTCSSPTRFFTNCLTYVISQCSYTGSFFLLTIRWFVFSCLRLLTLTFELSRFTVRLAWSTENVLLITVVARSSIGWRGDGYLYIHVLPNEFAFKFNLNCSVEKKSVGQNLNTPFPINVLAAALAAFSFNSKMISSTQNVHTKMQRCSQQTTIFPRWSVPS